MKKDNYQDILSKVIALLLSVQLLLVGLHAKNQIEDGSSTLEMLIWMIQQYIPTLKQIQSLHKKQGKGDSESKR